MWECNFAGETMNYKLFWLRFIKKIWLIAGAVILGALVVGVPYYLVNVTFGSGASYRMVTEYYLDYAEDGSGKTYDYFNYYTWSEILDTDEFIEILKSELPEGDLHEADILRAYTDATVESDTRYMTTTVQTELANKTAQITRSLEKAILVFGENQKELQEVRIVTQPMEAEKTYPDVRPVRATVLGAVLGLFVAVIGISISIVTDSSVHLPDFLEKRYAVKALGCKSFSESKNNVRYLEKKDNRFAVLLDNPANLEMAKEVLNTIKGYATEAVEIQLIEKSVLNESFDFDAIREYKVVVLLVEAGAHNGTYIERIIEQLKRQDVSVSGAFLYNEDEKLIKRYYR